MTQERGGRARAFRECAYPPSTRLTLSRQGRGGRSISTYLNSSWSVVASERELHEKLGLNALPELRFTSENGTPDLGNTFHDTKEPKENWRVTNSITTRGPSKQWYMTKLRRLFSRFLRQTEMMRLLSSPVLSSRPHGSPNPGQSIQATLPYLSFLVRQTG